MCIVNVENMVKQDNRRREDLKEKDNNYRVDLIVKKIVKNRTTNVEKVLKNMTTNVEKILKNRTTNVVKILEIGNQMFLESIVQKIKGGKTLKRLVEKVKKQLEKISIKNRTTETEAVKNLKKIQNFLLAYATLNILDPNSGGWIDLVNSPVLVLKH